MRRHLAPCSAPRSIPCWLVLAGFWLAGCGYSPALDAAHDAVDTFHARFGAREFDAIVEAVHPELLDTRSREDLIALLDQFHVALGPVVGSTTTLWNVHVHKGITRVTLTAATEFEKANGTETFAFRVESGEAFLVDYTLN